MEAQPQIARRSTERRQSVPLSLVGLLVVGFAALAAALLLRGGDSVPALPLAGSGPAAVSGKQLKELAESTQHPIYWAGKGHVYELTRTTDGRIYVRYLPSATKVGDRSAGYLTVGTYPDRHAFRSIKRAAARPGGISVKLDHGGLLVFNSKAPKSVYFAYPGARYQVEVFDPSAARARTLVLSGKITQLN
jgi:hypothetical protein